MAAVTVLPTGDPALLAGALRLRTEVFVAEQGVDPALERDGADPAALHVVALDPTGEVVGTGRVVEEGGTARLGRIAVRADQRGRGTGAAVVRALERVAARAGLPTLRLHSQGGVVDFYVRLGYRRDGPADVEAGLPHQWMRRELLPGLRHRAGPDAAAAAAAAASGVGAEGLVPQRLQAWMDALASGPAEAGLWVFDHGWAGWRRAGPGVVELVGVQVARPARGQGCGTALVGLVERAGRTQGAHQVLAYSDARARLAHRCLAAWGYRRDDVAGAQAGPAPPGQWCWVGRLEGPGAPTG